MTMSTDKTYAHIVSHSHWDREWYLPFEKHRILLVELMDTLIGLFESDPEFRSFHLDGQTIVLEDYLQIRPERKETVARLVREGKLLIGPWYVLQDEFLTSGEANVRNLLIGHRDARQFGPVCKLGYFPDSFGNMGQAPQLCVQAGIDTAIFGRGVKPVGFNNEVKGEFESAYSEMNWQSPDGSTVLGILFANWYNNGMEIPVEPAEAAAYWERKLHEAKRFASTPHLLFMNGCDHQPAQTNLSEAIRTASGLYPGIEFIHSSLPDYVAQLKASVPPTISTIRGELRSQRTNGWWTLANTASARVYIKQANQKAQTLLEKVAEPLAAFASMAGAAYPDHLLTYAWKTLMQNHPHDSICGCSVDEVHREMMTRFAKSMQVGEQIAADSLRSIVARIDTASAFAPEDIPFVVFNTSGWERTGMVSIDVEIERLPFREGKPKTLAERLSAIDVSRFAVKDAAGNRLDAAVEDVGVTFGYELPKDKFRQPHMARTVRVRLLAERVPALGYATFALVREEAGDRPHPAEGVTSADERVPDNGRTLENDLLSVSIAEDGTYDVTDKRTGAVYRGLGAYENVGDIGNEYIFRAPDGDRPLTTHGLPAHIRVEERTANRTVVAIVHEWDVPASADDTLESEVRQFVPFLERKAQRSGETVTLAITTRLTLERGVPQLAVRTSLTNVAKDYRLRVLFPAGIDSPVHYADSVFEVAQRDTAPAPEWTNPSNCQHQQAFVNVRGERFGLTVGNCGLNEYEVLRDGRGTMAVTLLRAVRELGDWGVFPTPEAQCQGDHTFDYTVIPHGGEQDALRSYTLAYQAQIPWVSSQAEVQTGHCPATYSFMDWTGDQLALTAFKLDDAGERLVARWFNMTNTPASLRPDRVHGCCELYRSNVLEEEGERIEPGGGLPVRGAEIVTLGGRISRL